jgi:hypothetical protein
MAAAPGPGAGGAPGPGLGGAGGAPGPGPGGAGGTPGPGAGGRGAGGPPPQPQPVVLALSPARASNVLLNYISSNTTSRLLGSSPSSTYPPVGCLGSSGHSRTQPGSLTGK